MEKNQSVFAIVQIGIGIISILMGISVFIVSVNYISGLNLLLMGTGVLLYGLTNNNADKSSKGKMLSFIASIFIVIASILKYFKKN